jgi:hypothetical protein
LWRTQIVDDKYSLVTAPFNRRTYGRVYAFFYENINTSDAIHIFFLSINTFRKPRILLTIEERERKRKNIVRYYNFCNVCNMVFLYKLIFCPYLQIFIVSTNLFPSRSFAFLFSFIYHSIVVLTSCLIVSYGEMEIERKNICLSDICLTKRHKKENEKVNIFFCSGYTHCKRLDNSRNMFLFW